MAFTDTPKLGVIIGAVQQRANDPICDLGMSHRLGSRIWDNLSRECVYAQASAAIPANATTVAINNTTFAAAATGGTFINPGAALAAGDRAWFARPAQPSA